MTETTFPFQPAAAVDEPESQMDEPARNNRLLLIIGVAAALVVGVAAYFLLFAGGGDSGASDEAIPPSTSAAVPQAAPSTAPSPVKQHPLKARDAGTDPFEPLLADADATTSGTSVGAAAATTTGTAAAAGTGTAATTAGSGTTAPAAATPHRFQVSDVAADNKTIDVKVDGKSYKSLRAGEVFAQIFKVRFIGGPSNSFQIGDETFNVVGAKAVTISG
jgi:hypothetical protein